MFISNLKKKKVKNLTKIIVQPYTFHIAKWYTNATINLAKKRDTITTDNIEIKGS